MKKLFFVLFALFAIESNAQSFSFTTPHTSLTDTVGSEIVFDFLLTNISQDTITVYIRRPYQALPENWESSLCFDINCFAPFIDSVATTIDFGSSPLAPGDTRDFSIHVYVNISSGAGYIGLFAGNLTNRNDTMSVDLTANAILSDLNDYISSPGFRLLQNYPNPFNPSTQISFELDRRSNITLDVYNINGEKVMTLLSGELNAGLYTTNFNADRLSSGVYIVKLSSGTRNSSIKLLLEK